MRKTGHHKLRGLLALGELPGALALSVADKCLRGPWICNAHPSARSSRPRRVSCPNAPRSGPGEGGAWEVAPDATAFAYRDATFAIVIAGKWPDPAQNEANTAWVRDYYDATPPHSEEGGYVNFMAEDGQDRVRSNYKANYDRLAAIKKEYDPGNLFRFNQNIVPS